MSKINLNSIQARMASYEKQRDVSIFKPTAAARQAKSNFWTSLQQEGIDVPPVVDLSMALMYGADRRISQWWEQEGFQDWFSNENEFKQRVDYLAFLALDELETILKDDNPKTAPSKVSAAKMILDAAHKMPRDSSGKEQFLDEKIATMDRKQLQDYINKSLHRVLPTENKLTDDDLPM